MKKLIILAGALSTVLLMLIYCAENDYNYDNPFDKKGTNYLFGDTTNEKEKIGDANGNTVGDLLDPKDTVKFNANEGSGTPPSDRTVATGANITLPSPDNLTRSDHAFGGWNTRPDGNGANYTGEYKVDGSTTLYAKWISTSVPQPDRYTVKFDANGADGTPPSAQMVDTGTTINLPNQGQLSREGYDFGGWNTERDGTGDTYSAGSPYKPTGDITLYAKWNSKSDPQPTTFTIAFSANGATSGTAPTDMMADSGITITLPGSNGLSRNNDTFGGWNTNSSGTGDTYSAGSPYKPTGDVTLYAKWNSESDPQPTTFTIAFRANGATSGTAPTDMMADSGITITLPGSNGLSRNNDTFGGWNTNSSGTGTNYSAGSSYTVNSNATLYAKWDAAVQSTTYTLTMSVYPNNSGTTNPASSQSNITAGTEVNISATAESGYTFANWTVTTGTATIANANSAATTVTLSTNATIRANFGETFTDNRDGKEYRWVQIGNQVWMAENLNYYVESSICYDNDPANCAKYGRLYDWSTAMGIDAKYNNGGWNGGAGTDENHTGIYWNGGDVNHTGICPAGWHIPSDAEWSTLMDSVGGSSTAGTKLKATSGWNDHGNGTDQYGFSALPGGSGSSNGNFNIAGNNGYWWSATETDFLYADRLHMYYYYEEARRGDYYKASRFSVRCVKDDN